MEIQELLRYVQRTNPQMTEEKLREELSKSTYSSMAILFTMENSKKKACWCWQAWCCYLFSWLLISSIISLSVFIPWLKQYKLYIKNIIENITHLYTKLMLLFFIKSNAVPSNMQESINWITYLNILFFIFSTPLQ